MSILRILRVGYPLGDELTLSFFNQLETVGETDVKNYSGSIRKVSSEAEARGANVDITTTMRMSWIMTSKYIFIGSR